MGRRHQLHGGFTLIELSIVLVIIGLILGGVLVGQSLISQAAVRSEIKQMQNLQTQVATFYEKYGCLPGDCSNATTFLGTTDAHGHAVSNGDGDGLIRSPVGGSGECVMGGIQGTELPQAFLQLNDAGVANYISDGTGNDMNLGWGPVQAINNGTGLLLTCLSDPVDGNPPLNPALGTGNVIVLGAYPNNTNPTNRIVYITGMTEWGQTSPIGIPADYVRTMDQKIDDGLPASGSFGVIGASGFDSNISTTPCLTNSNTAYPASGANCNATAGMQLKVGD